MDGMARPFGSGLEPESTGSGCWGEEEEKMTSMMRRRRWTGHPRKSSEARRSSVTFAFCSSHRWLVFVNPPLPPDGQLNTSPTQ